MRHNSEAFVVSGTVLKQAEVTRSLLQSRSRYTPFSPDGSNVLLKLTYK